MKYIENKVIEIGDFSRVKQLLELAKKHYVIRHKFSIKEPKNQGDGHLIYVKRLELFLLELANASLDDIKPSKGADNYAYILKTIHDNIEKRLSVTNIASLCSMSKINFFHSFSTYMSIYLGGIQLLVPKNIFQHSYINLSGLIKIKNFDARCAEETIAVIEDLLQQGAKKIIFDVRNNPGGYKDELVKVLDFLDGDEAGVKSVTFEVSGDHAYGYLRSEKGVHRLVRISPFDANARRHTSFSSLDVAPVLEEMDTDIEIDMKDVRVDTYHSSGAGGQNVNKTSSAVRMTHFPTGIVVACQTERDQVQNRATCIKMLKAKLLELKEREREQEMADIKGEMKKIEWGSQIRSYVFQPYTMVKDHRTGFEAGNIDDVMNGNIEGFTTAYLKMQ